MTIEYNKNLQSVWGSGWAASLSFLKGPFWKLVFAYLVLFAITAYLGRWTPDFLVGRSLWHFTISRMVIPFVMLGVFAAFIRVVPAALMLGASLLFIGTISAIKREATGEPFQVSDLFLAGQSTHLLGYVGWDKWLVGATILPASFYAFSALRLWPTQRQPHMTISFVLQKPLHRRSRSNWCRVLSRQLLTLNTQSIH
jgi:hypothetical protein